MSMNAGNNVPAWFADLPITDPRCTNDSCVAFKNAHAASQARVSWDSQFHYGWFVAWIYSGITTIFVALYLLHRLAGSRILQETSAEENDQRITAWAKLRAAIRIFSYRRIPGRLGDYLGLPSVGILLLILSTTVAVVAMIFSQGYYYREKRAYGSPPIGVRTGLMSASLIPFLVALSGKVSRSRFYCQLPLVVKS